MKKLFKVIIFSIPFFNYSQINLIKDFSGTASSNPGNGKSENFFVQNNLLFFNAQESDGFFRLFSSDGTEAGTVALLNESSTRLISEKPTWTIAENENNALLFLAYFENASNLPGAYNRAYSKIGNLYASLNYFTTAPLPSANEGQLIYVNLPATNSSLPSLLYFINENNLVRFSLNGSNAVSQGNVTSGWITINEIFKFNDDIYFVGDEGSGNGIELYKHNILNNTISMVGNSNINTTGDSNPSDFIIANNKLYFTAFNGTERQLYVHDPNAIVQIVPINNTIDAEELTILDTGTSISLILSSTVSGTKRLVRVNTANDNANLLANGGTNPSGFTPFNGFVYFSADGANGNELYKTNGINTSTGLVANINTSNSSSPRNFLEFNGNLYFNANDGIHGEELWKIDTSDNATLVQDFVVGSGDFAPIPLAVFNNKLILSGLLNSSERELYAYDEIPTLTFVPDDNFEQQLINLGYDTVLDDYVTTSNILNVETLILDGSGGLPVSDFTGLENFKNLKKFQSLLNTETILDFSQNTKIENVEITDFTLSNLILNPSDNPNLKEFIFGFTQLTSLNLSGFPKLGFIFCGFPSSQLATVDISNTTNASLNVNLSEANALQTIISNNSTALTSLTLDSNVLTNLDLTTNINLTSLLIIGSTLSELDLSNNDMLTNVILFSSPITTINLKNGNNTILTNFSSNNGNDSLTCIQVDDENSASNGLGVYASWQKPASAVYSENCSSLSVSDFNKMHFSVYPNPIENTFSIKGNTQNISQIEVYDINGRKLKTFYENQNTYSISEFNSGIYFINVKIENLIQTYKIIKN
ncbi:T9SS type A sorting domain-containing protein [Polaribacter sp.]|uniref:T9SS type A sorting domain-containing protein n=1 Tax=Polaribacter sp. TaxID=1920175 RepID=UPI004048DB5B